MKLVVIARQGRPFSGLVLDDFIIDPWHPSIGERRADLPPAPLSALLAGGPSTLSEVKRIRDWLLSDRARLLEVAAKGAAIAWDEAAILAPVPRPSLILCIGRSYGRHVAEMIGTQAELPKTPNGFLKSPHCVVGPNAPIRLPSEHPNMVDYEGEIALIFGKRCHNVCAKNALDYIAGYTLANEVSARDWNAPHGQPQNWDMVRLGKQFPTFCPMGPMLVTPDEIDDPSDMQLRTTVNGVTMQQASTSDLLFSFAEMISYYSRWYEFHPGDVLSTGTPEGVGASQKPPRFLREGDIVTVSSPILGALSNPVRSCSAASGVPGDNHE